MCIVFDAYCHVLERADRFPSFFRPPGALLCKLVLFVVIYLRLINGVFCWWFANPYYRPAVFPRQTYLDHRRVHLKRWWRVTKFIYLQYAGLCVQYLLRLAEARVQNRVRRRMGYILVLEPKDRLWLRELNISLHRQLKTFNVREMLPLDRGGRVYLNYENCSFPDFSEFLDLDAPRPVSIHEAAPAAKANPDPGNNLVEEQDRNTVEDATSAAESKPVAKSVAGGKQAVVKNEEAREKNNMAETQGNSKNVTEHKLKGKQRAARTKQIFVMGSSIGR
ncbi:hypothetical protein P171DRAFT_73097 [Karstenula rhodostoma CBS 690.94]|uniref:Uncharacterized protein n=1 Tax=Karstenula rhodostoma CBS 690.94 TaxID=1392251 RepID=A0A9P4U9W6_9PLEO|nr:hypothetical protein P171DRAFT_73097 [Karstenula rhodostoma CBS 690.94]